MSETVLYARRIRLSLRQPRKMDMSICTFSLRLEDLPKASAEARLIRAGFTNQNISALYSLPFKVTKNLKLSMFQFKKTTILFTLATNSSGLKLARTISINPVALEHLFAEHQYVEFLLCTHGNPDES